MANEGVIKLSHPVAGLGNITCKVLKPDDTVRDASIALIDTTHPNLYSNAGSSSIEVGDSKIYYQGAVNIGGGTHQNDDKLDDILSDVILVKAETDLLDGMIIEDSAGNYFAIAALVNAPTAEMDAIELAAAMKAIIGLTVGGTWTWEKIMKIMTAWIAGDWRVKPTDITKQELMDAEDGTTVILEQDLERSPRAGTNYRNITVKI